MYIHTLYNGGMKVMCTHDLAFPLVWAGDKGKNKCYVPFLIQKCGVRWQEKSMMEMGTSAGKTIVDSLKARHHQCIYMLWLGAETTCAIARVRV